MQTVEWLSQHSLADTGRTSRILFDSRVNHDQWLISDLRMPLRSHKKEVAGGGRAPRWCCEAKIAATHKRGDVALAFIHLHSNQFWTLIGWYTAKPYVTWLIIEPRMCPPANSGGRTDVILVLPPITWLYASAIDAIPITDKNSLLLCWPHKISKSRLNSRNDSTAIFW